MYFSLIMMTVKKRQQNQGFILVEGTVLPSLEERVYRNDQPLSLVESPGLRNYTQVNSQQTGQPCQPPAPSSAPFKTQTRDTPTISLISLITSQLSLRSPLYSTLSENQGLDSTAILNPKSTPKAELTLLE